MYGLSLRNNAYYFIGHLAAIPFEIAVASLLCGAVIGSRFFKAIVFMPYVINGVAVALAFSFFFSPSGGFNAISGRPASGSLKLDWLGDFRIVNFTLVFVSLWRYCGQHVVFFIAGIMSIPKDYYEAAKSMERNKFQMFTDITVPGIKTIVELILFLTSEECLLPSKFPS